jgi:hypothetical protein
VNSTGTPYKSRFELEALEPRVLLSSDAVFVSVIASEALIHKPVEVAHHHAAPSQFSQEQVAYHAGTEAGALFEGVATQPITSHHPHQDASPASPATASNFKSEGSGEVASTATGQTIVSTAGSVSSIAQAPQPKAASVSSSTATTTATSNATVQQLIQSLTAANGPPTANASQQAVQNKTVISTSNSSQKAGSTTVSSNGNPQVNPPDLFAEINTLVGIIPTSGSTGTFTFSYQSGTGVTQVGALANISVGGVLSITNATVAIQATISGSTVTVTGVTFTAASATLNLGSAFSSVINGVSATVTKGSQSNWSDASVSVTLGQSAAYPSGSVSFSLSSFLEFGATSATLNYTGGSQAVNLVNSTATKSSDTVNLLSLGISGGYLYAGLNGPAAGTSTLPASFEGLDLSGVNLALVVMNSTSGSGAVYYGLSASGSATGQGLPSSFTLGVSNMSVQVNGSNSAANGNVVNFSATNSTGFSSSGSGYSLMVGTTPIVLDYTTPLLQVSGTVNLSLAGYIYILGNFSFQVGTTATVNLTDGATTTNNGVTSVVDDGGTAQVSVLEVVATDVTIFVGINGPTGDAQTIPSGAVGVELNNANFTLVLMNAGGGVQYYGLQAGAGYTANLISSSAAFNSAATPSYSVTLTDFVQNQTYQFSLGNSTSLTVSNGSNTTTLTQNGTFVATSTTETLTFTGAGGTSGVGGQALTASVSPYYGLQAIGLPSDISFGIGTIAVSINGGVNNGNYVVDFDSSFTTTAASGNNPRVGGLTIQTSSTAAYMDLDTPMISVSGSLTLDLDGFIYVTGNISFQETSDPGATLNLAGGSSTTATISSILEIGGSDVTIFAGTGGPSSNAGAVGFELSDFSFALALVSAKDGGTSYIYYGLQAGANLQASQAQENTLSGVGLPAGFDLSGTNLGVAVNGSTDPSKAVANFASSFGSGAGLTVSTGGGNSEVLSFSTQLIQVYGGINLQFGSYISISGGFYYAETSGTTTQIILGSGAYTGASDLAFTVGSVGNPLFSASGSLDMTITAANGQTDSMTTITSASLSVSEIKVADVLDVMSPTVTITNISIDNNTGQIVAESGSTLTITAQSISLFNGSSVLNGSVTALSNDTNGPNALTGTFDLSTGAFSVILEKFTLNISTVLTATADDVAVTYSPAAGPDQQLVSISSISVVFNGFGGGAIQGTLTDLVIYGNGFTFASASLTYSGNLTISSLLVLQDPTITLNSFSVTFDGSSTSLSASSFSVGVTSASLTVGSFTAMASGLTISVSLSDGSTVITASSLSFSFGQYLSLEATNTITINTDPGNGGAFLTVGSASATISAGPLDVTGTATDFSIVDNNGTPEFQAGQNFSVSFSSPSGSALMLPSWLGFSVTQFSISWANFSADPSNFTIVISASITSIQGLPGGVTVSGEITDAVIDVGRLEQGLFPITSIGSFGGSVSGTLFGLEVNAGFVMGIVNLNAENQIVNIATGTVTNPTTGNIVANGDTTVTSSTLYVGLAGGAMIPGVGGVQIYIGFSQLGPLTFYLSAQFPLILDPVTGIAIAGFSGGVIFDYSLPTPTQPTDLQNISITPAKLDISQWQMQLEMQTVTQVAATSAGLSAYDQPFVIEAGVTLDDAYLTANAFNITGNLAIQINPNQPNDIQIFVTGTATFGDSVSFNAYLYANLDVQGAATTATFIFLVDEPANNPIESFGGALTFGFTDSNGNPLTPQAPVATTSQQTITLSDGTAETYTATQYSTPSQTIGGFYISLSGFLEYSALGYANVSISGGVTLTVTGTEAKLDLLGTLNVSFLGDIATAQGEFVINYTNPSSPEFYGALEVSTGAALAKLQTYGLNVDGAILFQINTTGVNQTVNLPNAPPANQSSSSGVTAPQLNGSNSTAFTIQGSVIFDLTITGTSSPYATISYEVNKATLFQMQGFFDLRLTDDPTNGLGLEMFADINSLTLGSGSTKFLSFSGFGLFVINGSGLAAEINLTLNSGNSISGVSFNANFQLVINTTSQAVTFNVPSVTVPTSTSDSTATAGINVYNADGSLAGTVTSLVIPAGPPEGSLQIINNAGAYAVTGAAGPYVVISGVGSLSLESLTLNGYFYFQVSDSSTGGFVLELVLSVTGNIPSVGTASVTGALQISSAGEVALLAIGGSAGNTTDYGSGISLQVTAELAVNTTSSNVSEIGGVPLTFEGNKITLAADTVQVVASGTLSLNIGGGTGFVISGTFSTTVTTAGGITATTITLNGTLTATVGGTTLLTMNAMGALVITSGGANPGVAGELSLTLAGSDPLDGNGFTFSGSFDLEVNTTGVQQIVNYGGSTTTIAAGPGGSSNGGSYIEVHAHGSLVFGSATNGFQLNNGDFYLLAGSTGLAVSASAALTIEVGGSQIFYASASGGMLITSNGIAVSITVNASLTDPSGAGLYAFSGAFSLQANTTGVQQTIGSGVNAVIIAAGPGSGGTPAGPYFQLYIDGTLVLGGTNATANTGLFINGSFYLAVGTSGITISVNGTLTATVGGTTLLSMAASGALVITTGGSNPGLAGELSLSITANSPLAGNGFSFAGTFNLQVNTTGIQQTVSIMTGGAAATTVISAGANGSSTGNPYFEVDGSGILTFGTATNGFNLDGDFYLSVSTIGLVVAANVNFNADVGGTSLLTMTASGALIITAGSNPGLAGELALTLNGADPLSGTGFNFNGTFGLEVNTTGVQQTVQVGTGTSAITTTISAGPNGSSASAVYFEIYASGSLVFGSTSNGFLLNDTNLYLSIGSDGLAVSASASMVIEVGGSSLLSVQAAGAMLISTSGFAASLTATASLNDPSGANLFAFGGTFTLQVNTTGVTQTIGNGAGMVTIPAGPGPNATPAGPYFQMYVSGTLALGTENTTASSGLFVNGNFYFSISTTGLTISANGTLTAVVGGDTLLTMTASGGLILNYGGANPGLAGDLVLTVSGGNPLSGSDFNFNGSFTLQVNTTLVDQQFVINGVNTTVTAGAGGSETPGAYFQIYTNGSIIFGTTSTGFALAGSFYLSIGTTGLFVSTNVTFTASILGENLLSLNASGAMEITSGGIAAMFTLTASGGAQPSFAMSGAFNFTGAFTFEINTTSKAVTDTVGGVKLNLIAGPYFEVAINGGPATGNNPPPPATLTLGPSGSVLSLSGYFDLTISSNGLAVTANATLSLLSLITFQATGALLINSTGIAAKITLTAGTGLGSSSNLFYFNASFLLEINSTRAAVNQINNVTVNLPAGPYFEIIGDGVLTIGGSGGVNITGSFTFTISNGSIQFQLDAVLDMFGIYFSVDGMAGFYSDGIAMSIQLSLGGSNSPTVTIIPDVLGLSGSFLLEFNSTGASHFNVGANTKFEVAVSASVNLFGFSIAQTSLTINYSNGVFSADGYFDLDFFGILTLKIDFYFDSHGDYAFYGSVSIQLGSGSFNIHGGLVFESANTSYSWSDGNSVTPVLFQITISGGVTAFDWNFASISATLSISSTYDVSVSVYVSVSFYFFSIGGTVDIDLGHIGAPPPPPPPPALGVVLTGPTTIDGVTFDSGTLLLDLGQYADTNRGVPALPDEDYTITSVNNGDSSDVYVQAEGVYDQAVEYQNVSKIVVPDADFGSGTSNVTVTISNGVTITVVVFSGSGNNTYNLGGGSSTVNGNGGVDTVNGGSGSVTFNVGNGTSTFTGGTANNIINNDPGNLTVQQSGYNNYDLNGDVLSYSDSGVSAYTDTINGPATIILTTPSSSAQDANFTVEDFAGADFAVTLNGNGNTNANIVFTNAGNINLSSVSLSGQTYGEISANGGSVVLESIPTVTLIGSSAGDQLTVTNGTDIPTINLQSTGGNEAFIINLIGGISYTVNATGSGTDTLVINGTDTNNTYSVTSTEISLVNEHVKFSAIQNTILNAGSGSDTVNVQSISDSTTLNLAATVNIVNVGSLAPTETDGLLSGVSGLLDIAGAKSGTVTLNVDDSGDASVGTVTLTTSTLAGTVFGTGGSLEYANVDTLNLYLGSGNHTVNIQGMSNTVNIVLGNGINVLNIGSNAGPIITDANPNDANTTLGDSADTGSTLDEISGVLTFTGNGDNIFNLDDSGSPIGLDGAMTLNSTTNLPVITFLNTTTLNDLIVINLPTVVSINLALSQGNDIFAVSDTFTSSASTVNSGGPVPTTPVVIDGNGGNDTFVILNTHAVMTVNGGEGSDQFFNFGNSSVLNLNGDAGNNTFYVYASVNENTSNLDPGSSDSGANQVYSYRVNAAVNIDGGSGNNTVYIFGTQYGDVITINGNQVTGAGLDVNLTSVQNLVVEGLGGNNTFYIESITIPTTIYGNGTIVPAPDLNILQALNIVVPTSSQGTPGNNTFYVGWQGASYIPGSLANFTAPLTIYGENGPNTNGSTTILPGLVNTIYVNDTSDLMDQQYTLTSSMLTSTAFGTGGSLTYDPAVQNLDISTGNGDNTITVNGTGTASQTSIYGGNGNDTFMVNVADGGSLLSPLALFGGLNTFAGDTLTVNGAPAGNTFNITGFTIDGAGATISYEEMEQLNVNAGGATTFNLNGDIIPTSLTGGSGNTIFNINSSEVPLTLTGGTQNNTFNINANAGPLTATGGNDGNTFTVNGNSGTLTIVGGVGNDQFTVNGNAGTLVGTGSSGPNLFMVNANAGSLSLTGGSSGSTFIVDGNSGTLTLTGGASSDSFTINALSAAATVNGGAGANLFYVTGPLGAALTVNGGGDPGDLLTISGTAGNDYVTITSSTVSGIGAVINYDGTNLTVDGVSGNDTYIVSSTSSFITRINGGTVGNNTFDLQGNTGALYITGGMVGNNTFNVGSLAPVDGGTLTALAGPIYLTGGSNIMRLISLAGASGNTLNVDDSGDTVANTGTLTSSTLTGLGLGVGITYTSINTLNISLGLGVDTFGVESTNSSTRTLLNTGPAADTVNVGSNEPDASLTSAIQGALTIVGAGDDVLNVNDAADTVGETGTLTNTVLSGLGMGVAGITYSGLVSLNIYLGLANDTFNVLSTAAMTVTTINAGTGVNVVNVGSNAPATGGVVADIQGGLIIAGSGADTLNVDDTGDTVGQSGTLSATTLTGLGLGTGGITYSGLAALNINLGSGNDTFTVIGVTPVTASTINGGPGINTAIINVTGNLLAQNLTLLNFNTTSVTVTGNFGGVLNDGGTVTSITIGGSLTSGAIINVGSVSTVTISGDLAGLLNVTGQLGTLTVDGGTPGQIVAGSVQIITVLAGYGNTVLNLTVNGVQREILATPVTGGTLPNTVHFAFVYDAVSSTIPQVAIRITNSNPVAQSFNLALLVLNSSTAKFDLSRLDSTGNGQTGIGNVSIQGDLLTQLTAPELALFTNLTAKSPGGVVLPVDSIIGVEVSGNLPIGYVDVAGIEGFAFSVLTTAAGIPISVTTPLGQGSSLTSLFGSTPVIDPATGAFVVPFTQNGSVRLYVHDDTTNDLNLIMTLTAELNNNLPVVATVQVVPTTSASINPLVQSVVLSGNGGGAINSTLSVGSITSAGPLGDVTIGGAASATMDNAPGLGSITAPSIFGSINVTNASIYGVIQTTSGDLGEVITGPGGAISGVTTIFANGAITGQIISRGNLVSSITTNGSFSGVIAAQGDIGVIQRNGSGAAVTNASNALTRFGGISIAGNDSGLIVGLGNLFGNLTVNGTMTGRVAMEGQAVSGLAVTRMGILGNISVQSFATGSAIISGGLAGDATGGTNVYLGSPLGFVAAAGAVNLRSTTIPAGKLLANQTGANLAALNAIFTNNNMPLLFDTGGTLNGLALIEADLENIQDNGGTLSGTIS